MGRHGGHPSKVDVVAMPMEGRCAVSAHLFLRQEKHGTARRPSLQVDIVAMPMEGRCAVSANLFQRQENYGTAQRPSLHVDVVAMPLSGRGIIKRQKGIAGIANPAYRSNERYGADITTTRNPQLPSRVRGRARKRALPARNYGKVRVYFSCYRFRPS